MSLQLNSRPASAINGHSKLFEHLDTYISVLNSNGASRQAMEDAFQNVFHDDLVFNIGGRTLNKEEVRPMVFQNFEDSANISFGKLEVIDASHIECIFRKEGKESGFERHQVLTTKGDKIMRVDPYDDVGTLLYHLNAYISIQNSDGSTLQDLETVFEDIFHDDLVADIEVSGPGLRKEDARKMIEEDFAQKVKLSFDKMDVVDASHVEIVINNEGQWRRLSKTARSSRSIPSRTSMTWCTTSKRTSGFRIASSRLNRTWPLPSRASSTMTWRPTSKATVSAKKMHGPWSSRTSRRGPSYLLIRWRSWMSLTSRLSSTTRVTGAATNSSG